MVLWPIYLIAIISTVGCIILWFRDVRRVMREQESTVESAHRELAVWRDKAQKAQGDPERWLFARGVKMSINKPWLFTIEPCKSPSITCLPV